MKQALREAKKNLKSKDGGPFGACIVKKGKVLAIARNKVLKSDATSHAEINAIRLASKRLKTFDLSGCTIYSTTEPCPMCFSAIHWARISKIVYGTPIGESRRLGFNELDISNQRMKTYAKTKVTILAKVLHSECFALLREWSHLDNKNLY
tara:strand:+ start:125 stop:577 length:453 start_codon:yes stop_codon:yes gene_type:complete